MWQDRRRTTDRQEVIGCCARPKKGKIFLQHSKTAVASGAILLLLRTVSIIFTNTKTIINSTYYHRHDRGGSQLGYIYLFICIIPIIIIIIIEIMNNKTIDDGKRSSTKAPSLLLSASSSSSAAAAACSSSSSSSSGIMIRSSRSNNGASNGSSSSIRTSSKPARGGGRGRGQIHLLITLLLLLLSHAIRTIYESSSSMFVVSEIFQDQNQEDATNQPTQQYQLLQQPRRRPPRVLFGIMSCDFGTKEEIRYRKFYRKLLTLHPKVCSLGKYIQQQVVKQQDQPNNGKNIEDEEPPSVVCEYIYTFVIGANNDPNAPKELVTNTSTFPILNTTYQPKSKDLLMVNNNNNNDGGDDDSTYAGAAADDVTFLNIQENMKEGKSQSWFYYESLIAYRYDIDYIGKTDTDTLPYLDQFFNHFAPTTLLPAPYDHNIFIGRFVDRLWWDMRGLGTPPKKVRRRREDLLMSNYRASLNLFAEGQLYILSKDLAKGVADQARIHQWKNYATIHEDQDVAFLAFLAAAANSTATTTSSSTSTQLTIKAVSDTQRFWVHPIKQKNKKRFFNRWNNEIERMENILQSGGSGGGGSGPVQVSVRVEEAEAEDDDDADEDTAGILGGEGIADSALANRHFATNTSSDVPTNERTNE